jgi:class 3 adenylate cyclase
LENKKDRKLLAVVFTDIAGFSSLTQKDESKALEFVSRYREIVKRITKSHRGEVIHFYGDGSLTVHTSTLDAVQCALAMQTELSNNPKIPVRVGIHFGEVVISGETVYGNAVNIASRIQNLASGHSILISGYVAKEIANQSGINTIYIGPEKVKNIKEAVDIYAISHTGLVIPSRQEVHDRNKSSKKTPYLISAVVAIAIILGLAFEYMQDYLPWSKGILDERILVIPFKNETGDKSLDEMSGFVAACIHNMMKTEEDIKLVSMRNIWADTLYRTFSLIPYPSISRMTNAENFIEGKFELVQDSMLSVSSVLVNGKTEEDIKQFPLQLVNMNDPIPGFTSLAQRIVGYLISADDQPLSMPTKDAYKAFIEALRVWKVNRYKDSRNLLLSAIEYDSTFIDAYYALLDTYTNVSEYEKADSVYEVIGERFKIETQTSNQKNNFYYYAAFLKGDYPAAFKYLENDYKEDKKELFTNTTTADVLLFFLNAPKQSLKVLNKIPFSKLDFELPDIRLRLTIGIQANYAIGKFKNALKLASLYPSNGMTRRQHKMRIRAFAGMNDTTAINKELAQIKLKYNADRFIIALHWASQQFRLQKDEALAEKYLRDAYSAIMEHDTKFPVKANVFYDMGLDREGLDHALFLYDYAPYYAPYASLVAQGYARIGAPDSARIYSQKIHSPEIRESSLGQSSYQEAIFYTVIGDYQSALIKLQSAIDEGLVFKENLGEFDPALMPLFELEEFQKIMHPLRK